jgi:hypothetical protein
MKFLVVTRNLTLSGAVRLFIVIALVALTHCLPVFGQSGDATLAGSIKDSSGAAVQHASITVSNEETGIASTSSSNGVGLFSVSGLTPGKYRMRVQFAGFADVDVTNITLSVGDKRQLDIKLSVAQAQETVQVNAGGATLNTSNATVSTVINREFVDDIPLNGRSFQTLILLAPGVVTATPQGNDPGQFSVNGQRTNSNYYILDGVSANNGADVVSSSSTTGMAANGTALGTTQAILPVDALQEFRISTSTYSAEYGRQPGAQVSFLSRSGANGYHGGAFEYLRNTIFDANDWFNTYTNPVIPRLAERQNDFGGFVSGPLNVPKLYSGRDRAFFFFAYEGLRVALPTPATIIYVPSNGTFNTATYSNALLKNVRLNAPAVERPALNAYPLPNCSTVQNPQCIDYADGLSPYLFSGSYPSVSNSISARIDEQVAPWLRVFARYSDSPSTQISHITNGLNISTATFRTRTFLLGTDSLIHGSIANELRLQYSPSSQVRHYASTDMGGATPNNLNTLQGLPAMGGESIFITEDTTAGTQGRFYSFDIGTKQFQPNAVDTLSWTKGAHTFKVGVDYRQTTTYLNDGNLSRGPGVYYIYNGTSTSASQILANSPQTVETFNDQRQDPTTKNLGLFFADEWRVNSRLSLSLGLRWDLNPPPSISGAQQYTYTGDINTPATLALSALGAPLYQTVYKNFQPRVGAAYLFHKQPGHETILRAGGGLFYDTVALYNTVGSGFSFGADYEGFLGTTYKKPQAFPVPLNTILVPIPNPTAPYSLNYIIDPHVHPPSTVQWNASLEQAFGARQSFTVGYVGANGRDLINWKEYSIGALNPLFGTIVQFENGPGSSYNALQAQVKRQAFDGLQLLASYTWSHAIDSDSTDFALLPVQRGNSSHDVRNSFSAAAVYALPGDFSQSWERAAVSGWKLSLFVVSRSGFPVTINGPTVTDIATGDEFPSRLNYNGKNAYVYKPGIPGGREFDPSVFSVPTAAQKGVGNAPRNFLRGFGETSADMAVQRTFPLYEQLHLQFRAEAFNLLNHPNFGNVSSACGTSTAGATCNSAIMGQATNTLSNALTGAASIYQEGGPRSLQLALRLEF